MQPVAGQECVNPCIQNVLVDSAGSPERRTSLRGPVKRLTSSQRPESHPVSPASSAGGGDASPLPHCKAFPGSSLSTSPVTVHFTIPAYHSNEGDAGGQDEAVAVAAATAAAAAPAAPDAALQASLPAASLPAANRIVLSLVVQEDGKVGAELAERNGCLSSAQERLDEAQQQVQPAMSHPTAFAQPGAAVGSASSSVLRHSAATDAELPAAAETDAANTTDPADQPVQVVFNILESHLPEDQENSAGMAGPPGEDGAELPGACPPSDISAAEQASIQQQLQRVEACREELARQAGQLRGRVAKLEGAVLAGESRVRAQAAELEALKAGSKELQQQLAAAQAQLAVTPDRSRAERQRLAERAAEAQAAADTHAARAQQLAAVLAFESKQRRGVDDFAALEFQLLSEREQGLESELAQWRRDAATATAQLAEARLRLVDTDAALLLRDDVVVRLRAEVEAAQSATAGAEQLAADWRHKAEQLEADRQASAALTRRADRELELVLQDNERMFRQLNFVRTRLMGQLGSLDPAVPDIGKLARELQSWCDREAAQRGRGRA